MLDWQPTMNLRFVRRDTQTTVMRILQQQWERETSGYGLREIEYEWRDVPEVSSDDET